MLLQVLLAEDSAGDVRLTPEAFREVNLSVRLHVAGDGADAMAFRQHEGIYAGAPRPDLTLLDLSLPEMDGQEVLPLIKTDDNLRSIPTVILTTSQAEADVVKS